MPLHHRVGDKKRYHYGGGPGGRYSSHGRSSGLVHSGSSSSISNTMNGSAPNSGTASPTQYNGPRPSRYDPLVSNRPLSGSSSRPGSRFNPNVSITENSQPGLKRSTSDNNTSRWVGSQQQQHSRYNPQSGSGTFGTSKAGSLGSSGPSTAPGTSSYHNSYYVNNSNQHNNYFSPRPSRPKSSFDSFTHLSSESYDAKQPTVEKHYKNKTKPMSSSSLMNSRGSFWRGSRINKFHGSSRYNGFKKHEYAGDNTYDISKPRKILDTNSQSSGLINSVIQTTRKAEEIVHQEHRRISMGKEQFTEDISASNNFKVEPNHAEDEESYKSNSKDYEEQFRETETDQTELKIESRENEHQDDQQKHKYESTMEAKTLTTHTNENLSSYVQPEKIELHPNETSNVVTEDFDELDESMSEQMNTIQETAFQENVKPLLESSHIPTTNVLPIPTPYPEPIKPLDSCIFPMKEPEMKLWLLKNQPRSEIIKFQKYLLKKPIKFLLEYPFFTKNWLIHKQAIRPILLENISKHKRYEYTRKIQLKDQFLKLEKQWENKCAIMDKSSEKFRKIEGEEQDKINDHHTEKETPKQSTEQRPSSSRRRNRADFVDDNDIENVLLQIDPEYKHHQLAATIPPMIINPLRKHSMKFKDVNNLVTDKERWASRILTDPIDTFTPYEHEMFVEGYLAYPKKFGKISNYMGGLRTPEECVMHYYITKKSSNYKKLLLEKNKKRKSNVGRRKKEKGEPKKKDKEDETLALTSEQKNGVDMNEFVAPVDYAIRTERSESKSEELLLKKEDVCSNTESEHEDAVETETSIRQSHIMDDFQISKSSKSPEYQDVQNKSVDGNLTDVASNTDQGEHPSTISNEGIYHSVEDSEDTREEQQPPKKKFKHSDAGHKSSYWSVQESKKFPELLKEFGTDWMAISEKLGTKSTTMVKNYFQRKAEQNGWLSLVESVDKAKLPTTNTQILSSESSTMMSGPIQDVPVVPLTSVNGATERMKDEASKSIQKLPQHQMPAVGYFAEKGIHTINRPFSNSNGIDESFSRLPTPSHGLPPQHKPVISSFNIQKASSPKLTASTNFGSGFQPDVKKQHSSSFQPTAPFSAEVRDQPLSTHPTHPLHKELTRKSSIRSLLNDREDSELKLNLPGPIPILTRQTPGASNVPILRPLTSTLVTSNGRTGVPTSASNVIVQELNTGFNHQFYQSQNLRTSSTIQTHVPNPIPVTTPADDRSRKQPTSSINFANDPLAALAAVASSETLALFPPTTKTSQSDQKPTDRPTTNYY